MSLSIKLPKSLPRALASSLIGFVNYVVASSYNVSAGNIVTLTFRNTSVTNIYQWIDANNNDIVGETSNIISWTADSNGQPRIRVTNTVTGISKIFGAPYITVDGAFSPRNLTRLLQFVSEPGEDLYYPTKLDGISILYPHETYGTVRAPQPGACGNFDGVNDVANAATSITSSNQFLTVSAHVKDLGTQKTIMGEWASVFFFGADGDHLNFYISGGHNASANGLTRTGWHHYAAVYDGTAGTVKLYFDGVQVGTTLTGCPATLPAPSVAFTVAHIGSYLLNTSIRDVRIYSVAKTAPEVAAIAACDFTSLDTTGILGGWYFNDRAGTVARDWSGNGHNLTLVGPITESTFWAEDAEITTNPANVIGYTLSGATVIPRDESDISKDVQGNALGNTGISPYPVSIATPCITFSTTDHAIVAVGNLDLSSSWTVILRFKFSTDVEVQDLFGSGDSISTGAAVAMVYGTLTFVSSGTQSGFGSALTAGTWYNLAVVKSGTTVSMYIDGVFWDSDTYAPTAVNSYFEIGSLFYSASRYTRGTKSICDVRVYQAAKSGAEVLAIHNGTDDRTNLLMSWKCQEGPGLANDNRTLYDDSGNGKHLTVTNGTVTTQWANRCPGYVRDHAFEHGGRINNGLSADVPTELVGGKSFSASPRGLYVSIADDATLDCGDVVSLAAWIRRDVVSRLEIVIDKQYAGYALGLQADGTAVLAKSGIANIAASTVAITDADWHHIAATKNGATVKVYVDGVECTGTVTNATLVDNTSALLIGSNLASLYDWSGQIDDARVYSVELSAAQVLELSNGSNATGATPVVHLTFDTDFSDSSGNDNDGTLIGGGQFVPLVPGTLLCADGQTATIAAGNIAGNPYSRVDFDPFSAAELGALNVPGEFDSLPCVTGNGSDVRVVLDSAGEYDFLHADTWSVELCFKAASGQNDVTLIANQKRSAPYQGWKIGTNATGKLLASWIDNSGSTRDCITSTTVTDSLWHHAIITKTGNNWSIVLDGVTHNTNTGTVGADFTYASDTMLLAIGTSGSSIAHIAGSISEVIFTMPDSSVKLFPLTDGSGADIAYYESGVATIISNAIQGTLTNVWANKTDGQVDHEFPEAVRAIVPRDTKFIAQDGTRALTFSEAQTGADLTSILDYLQ